MNAVVTTAALAGATAIPLKAKAGAEADPIFALIKAHKRAKLAEVAAIREYQTLDEEFSQKNRAAFDAWRAYIHREKPNRFSDMIETQDQIILVKRKGVAEDHPAPVAKPEFNESPEGISAKDRIDRAGAELKAAQVAILTTAPTTIAGVAAVLRYAMAGQYAGDFSSIEETVLGNAFADGTENGFADTGYNFLPMIAETIERLAA